jgi:hypothetical protein
LLQPASHINQSINRVNLSFTGRASPFNGLDQAFMELNRSLASPSVAREGASKMLRRNND